MTSDREKINDKLYEETMERKKEQKNEKLEKKKDTLEGKDWSRTKTCQGDPLKSVGRERRGEQSQEISMAKRLRVENRDLRRLIKEQKLTIREQTKTTLSILAELVLLQSGARQGT